VSVVALPASNYGGGAPKRLRMMFRTLTRRVARGIARAGCGASSSGALSRSFASSSSSTPGANKGPVGWVSLVLVSLTGAGCLYAYDVERQRRLNAVAAHKGGAYAGGAGGVVAGGKAAVGGAFELTNAATGKRFTDRDLHGKFALLYFGFTYCPDICPDELEKVAEVVDGVNAARAKTTRDAGTSRTRRGDYALVPVFITIDPYRDDKKRVNEYVKEFHKDMIGLTGSEDACGNAARKYRVYYRKTGDEKAKKDYLVDHSIITYLVDPRGDFVTFYGKNTTASEVKESILNYMEAFDKDVARAAP
jgi:protein SCO1